MTFLAHGLFYSGQNDLDLFLCVIIYLGQEKKRDRSQANKVQTDSTADSFGIGCAKPVKFA